MNCLQCGVAFTCGIDDPAGCWCSRDFPAVMPMPKDASGCFCPRCLEAKLARYRLPSSDVSGAPEAGA